MIRQQNTSIRLLLILVVLLVFGRTLFFSFVLWDDDIHLYNNMLMNPPTWHALSVFFREPFFGLYIPFTYTFWLAIAWLTSCFQHASMLLPAPFHLANVLMHAANVLLVYQLILRLFKNKTAAAVGALLFAVHPLQVEAVAWVSGAKDLLCALCSLLALLLALAGRKEKRLALTLFATLFFALALLAKPTAVALPAMLFFVFLLDVCREKRPRARDFLIPLCWGVLAAPLIVFTWRLQSADTQRLTDLSLPMRCVVSLDATLFYLSKLFLPYPLLADYGRTPDAALAAGWSLSMVIGLLSLVLVGIWLLRSRRWPLIWAMLVAACALAPNIGLVPFAFQHLSTVADRYAYLPMIGIAIAAGWMAVRPDSSGWLWRGSVGVVLLLWAVASCLQCAQFRDTASLFSHVLTFNPRSFSAHNNLGIIELQQGKIADALTHLTEASRLYPRSYKTIDNMGVAMQRQGQFSEAIVLHRRAIAEEQGYATAYVNLAEAFRQLGDQKQAKVAYLEALRRGPKDYLAHNNYGVFLENQGLLAEAEEHYQVATSLRVQPYLANLNLGILYEKWGRLADAAKAYEAALGIRPEAQEALDGLRRVRSVVPSKP